MKISHAAAALLRFLNGLTSTPWERTMVNDGGKGSGNWNHQGRPGRIGGSGKGGGTKKASTAKRSRGTIRIDQHGQRFAYPTRRLPKAEYAKVIHEIDTNYSLFRGKKEGVIVTNPGPGQPAYTYLFEIHEYEGDYAEFNIFRKRRNK